MELTPRIELCLYCLAEHEVLTVSTGGLVIKSCPRVSPTSNGVLLNVKTKHPGALDPAPPAVIMHGDA